MTERARNVSASLLVMAGSAYWVVEASRFRPLSRIFPQVLGGAVFLLALTLGILTLIGKGPTIKLSSGDAGARHLRAGTLIGAMLVWTALIPLVGLLVASILGVVGIGVLTFRAQVGTIRAILIAVISVVVFYILFAVVLNVPFPGGILF